MSQSFCRYFGQYLLIRGSTVLCEVTGKRVNRGAAYGLEVPCRYTIHGYKLGVRWLSEFILKEATIVKDAVVRNLETKTGRKRKTKSGDCGDSSYKKRIDLEPFLLNYFRESFIYRANLRIFSFSCFDKAAII